MMMKNCLRHAFLLTLIEYHLSSTFSLPKNPNLASALGYTSQTAECFAYPWNFCIGNRKAACSSHAKQVTVIRYSKKANRKNFFTLSSHVLPTPIPQDEFARWMDFVGLKQDKVQITEFNSVRGVAARKSIVAGEDILSVPLTACLVDPIHLPAEDCPHPLARRAELPWQSRMSLFLAIERRKGAESPLAPYIAVLPPNPPLIAYAWPEWAQELLQDPWFAADFDSLLFWESSLYDDIICIQDDEDGKGRDQHDEFNTNNDSAVLAKEDDIARGAAVGVSKPRPLPLPSREEFVWALRTIQSRTIRVDGASSTLTGSHISSADCGGRESESETTAGTGGGGDKEEYVPDSGVRAMVPLLDMLNHDGSRWTEFYLVGPAGSIGEEGSLMNRESRSGASGLREWTVRLRLNYDVAPGEQVWLNYGHRGAEHWLSFYGFVPMDSGTAEHVALRRLPLVPQQLLSPSLPSAHLERVATMAAATEQALAVAGGAITVAPGHVPHELIDLFRAVAAAEAVAAAGGVGDEADAFGGTQVRGEQRERQGALLLRRRLEMEAAAMGTSLEDDHRALNRLLTSPSMYGGGEAGQCGGEGDGGGGDHLSKGVSVEEGIISDKFSRRTVQSAGSGSGAVAREAAAAAELALRYRMAKKQALARVCAALDDFLGGVVGGGGGDSGGGGGVLRPAEWGFGDPLSERLEEFLDRYDWSRWSNRFEKGVGALGAE